MHKSPRFKISAGSTVWNKSHPETHRHLGKLAGYFPIRNIEHPQSHQLLTQENFTSVSQQLKEHFKNHSQKLCAFHLLAFSNLTYLFHVFLTWSSLNYFLFRNSKLIWSCTFLEYFWLANMVVSPSLLALIKLSNMPCATFPDKNLP